MKEIVRGKNKRKLCFFSAHRCLALYSKAKRRSRQDNLISCLFILQLTNIAEVLTIHTNKSIECLCYCCKCILKMIFFPFIFLSCSIFSAFFKKYEIFFQIVLAYVDKRQLRNFDLPILSQKKYQKILVWNLSRPKFFGMKFFPYKIFEIEFSHLKIF